MGREGEGEGASVQALCADQKKKGKIFLLFFTSSLLTSNFSIFLSPFSPPPPLSPPPPRAHTLAMARELVTLQCGPFSNFVGAHFWNAQEAMFSFGPDAPVRIEKGEKKRQGRRVKKKKRLEEKRIEEEANGRGENIRGEKRRGKEKLCLCVCASVCA